MIRNDCEAYDTMMQDLINYIDHVFEFLIWRRPTKRPHNLIHFQTSYTYQYIRLSRVREAPQLHMKPTYKAFLIIVTKFSFTLKSFVTCPSSSSPIEPPPSLNPIKTQCCCQQCYFCCFQHLWCHHQHHKHDAQEPPVKEGENLAILFQQVKRETFWKLFGKSTFLPEKFWEKNTFYSLSFLWSPYQDPRQTSSQNLRQSY